MLLQNIHNHVIATVIYFTFQRTMIGNKTFGCRTSNSTTYNSCSTK